jgi:hypothetical protein
MGSKAGREDVGAFLGFSCEELAGNLTVSSKKF